MKFSREMDQALRSLGYLAGEKESLSAREISESQSIPYEKTSKMLQKLSSARIVSARRGREGGYHLTRPLDELNLLELHRALGETAEVAPCSGNTACRHRGNCGIRTGLSRFQEDLNHLLEVYTVADITGVSHD